jgi:hypothetical protein
MIAQDMIVPRPGFSLDSIQRSMEVGFAEVLKLNGQTVIQTCALPCFWHGMSCGTYHIVADVKKMAQVAKLEDVMTAFLKNPKAKKPQKPKTKTPKKPVTRQVRRIQIEEVNAEVRKLLQHMIDLIDNDPLADFEPILKTWTGSFGHRPPNGKGEIVIYTGLVKDGDTYRIATEPEMEVHDIGR